MGIIFIAILVLSECRKNVPSFQFNSISLLKCTPRSTLDTAKLRIEDFDKVLSQGTNWGEGVGHIFGIILVIFGLVI